MTFQYAAVNFSSSLNVSWTAQFIALSPIPLSLEQTHLLPSETCAFGCGPVVYLLDQASACLERCAAVGDRTDRHPPPGRQLWVPLSGFKMQTAGAMVCDSHHVPWAGWLEDPGPLACRSGPVVGHAARRVDLELLLSCFWSLPGLCSNIWMRLASASRGLHRLCVESAMWPVRPGQVARRCDRPSVSVAGDVTRTT